MAFNLALALEYAFLLLMAIAAVRDLAAWRLPNWLCLTVAVLFIPWAWASGASWSAVGWSVAAGILVLGAGYLLYELRLWGAGDAKLAAAVALWIGLNFQLLWFLAIMSLAGGVLAMAALALHAWTGEPQLPPSEAGAEAPRRNPLKAKTRYGVAIAIGAVDFWLRQRLGICLIWAC
jgi:prepilin peptidase CpaA